MITVGEHVSLGQDVFPDLSPAPRTRGVTLNQEGGGVFGGLGAPGAGMNFPLRTGTGGRTAQINNPALFGLGQEEKSNFQFAMPTVLPFVPSPDASDTGFAIGSIVGAAFSGLASVALFRAMGPEKSGFWRTVMGVSGGFVGLGALMSLGIGIAVLSGARTRQF